MLTAQQVEVVMADYREQAGPTATALIADEETFVKVLEQSKAFVEFTQGVTLGAICGGPGTFLMGLKMAAYLGYQMHKAEVETQQLNNMMA